MIDRGGDLVGLDSLSQRVIRAVEDVGPKVVSIRTRAMRRFGGQVGAGSGVIIGPQGLVLTNSHVIHEAGEILVSLRRGQDYEAAVVGEDPDTDLAVLHVPVADPPLRHWAIPIVFGWGNSSLPSATPLGSMPP